MKKIFVLFILSVMFLGPSLIFAEDIIPKIEEPTVTLISIAITSEMETVKTEYFVGEELDITGLEVTGTYSDDTTQVENIILDNITGFDSSLPVVGQVLTITVLNQTVSYTINIEAIPTIIENQITIRNGETIVYAGKILFPETEEMVNILGQEISNQSVLGLLYTLDQRDDSFSISDLSYNESFGAFLLNCITPRESEALCYEWQYVVDGYYPNIGMDKNILSGGENIYLFFGQTDRILLSASSIDISEDLTVTTEKYDFENNQWLVKTGVTVGITKVNSDDPYNPIEIQSGVVDENGQKVFSSIPLGSYSAGIKVDDNGSSYYWPTVNFEVIESSSGGNSGGEEIPDLSFSIGEAVSFLLANQNADGSFQNDMYTDWVAIASAGTNEGSQLKEKVYDYLINNEFESSLLTDYERHAMALMAMNIDPYNGTEINYIKKIVDSFDGEQLGEEDLLNDDIFGLLVLAKGGYEESDEIISKTLEFIINQQGSNGSFGSIDMTSAFIQAVKDFDDTFGLNEAREKAENYLIENQDISGSFGDPFSTSWALQALSINNSFENETQKAKEYLKDKQQEDGGVGESSDSLSNRIWATSYAIPAVLQLSWVDILESFEKEEIITPLEDEETVEEEDTPVELIEAPVQVEIPIEKITIDGQEIKNLKKNLVVEKKEEKNVIDIKNEVNNVLLANAAGAVIEINENQSLFFQKINNFFQRLFSYLKAFRHRLLTME